MHAFPARIILCFLLLIFVAACAKDSDLTDNNSSAPTSLVEVKMIDTELEDSFSKDGGNQVIIVDSIPIMAPVQELAAQKLQKIHLTTSLVNEHDQDYLVVMEFLDKFYDRAFSYQVFVDAGNEDFPRAVTCRMVIDAPELEKLMESTHIRYTVQPADTISVPTKSSGVLKLQANATYYFGS